MAPVSCRRWTASTCVITDRGKATPPQATVYRTAEINGYRCDICGYVYEGENPPAEGYRCPICKADHTHFHLIEK